MRAHAKPLMAVTIFGAALALLVGVLDVGAGASSGRPAAVAKKKHRRGPKLPQYFVGMVASDFTPYSQTNAYWNKQFAGISKTGVKIMRATVEVHGDTFALDRFILDAAKHKISIMPMLFDGARLNDSHGPDRGFTPPPDLSTFTSAAQTLVERYGPKGTLWTGPNRKLRKYAVRNWQIWNEPNLPVYWQPKPDPKAYMQMVKATGAAIRHVDKGAQILSAGIPNSVLSKPRNYKQYLTAFLKDGGWRYVNAVGVHAYAPTTKAFQKVLTTYRKLLNAHHGRKLKLWITEVGWADKAPNKSKFVVGSKGQANRIRGAWKLLHKIWPKDKIAGVMYFEWKDLRGATKNDPNARNWGYHTGLLRTNGKRKPAYKAFTQAVKALKRR